MGEGFTPAPPLLSQPEPGPARWGKVRLKQGQRETVLLEAGGEGGLDSAGLASLTSAALCKLPGLQIWV